MNAMVVVCGIMHLLLSYTSILHFVSVYLIQESISTSTSAFLVFKSTRNNVFDNPSDFLQAEIANNIVAGQLMSFAT